MKTLLKLSAWMIPAVAYILLLIYDPFSPAAFFVGIPVCLLPIALIHEFGHLLAYVLLKLEWKRITLSLFVFEQGKGFFINSQNRVFAASCTCAYHPATPFWRYRIALLSGGISAFLFGLAAVCLSFLAVGSWASFFLCLGTVGIVTGAFNLFLPFSADRVLLRKIQQEREKNS